MMIRAYRMRGHLHANLDPLNLEPKRDHEELHPSSYGFTEADYDRKIFLDNLLGYEFATLREMLAVLERTYCSTIGYEFMHISNPQEKGWLQERIEGPDKEIAFTPEGKRAILNKLVQVGGLREICRSCAIAERSVSGSMAPRRWCRRSSRSSSAAARSACARSCSAYPIAAASTCSPM